MTTDPDLIAKRRAVVDDFHTFCTAHPELRLWQALAAWSGLAVYAGDEDDRDLLRDTFYWEGRCG